MPSGPTFDLAEEILRVLAQADGPLWASEIADLSSARAGFEVDRRDVNRCLYGAKLRDKVRQQSGSKWVLAKPAAKLAQATGSASVPATGTSSAKPASASQPKPLLTRDPPWDRFGRFVSYYLDCVREDESEGAERFLSDAGKRFTPFPLSEEWSLSGREAVEMDLSGSSSGFVTELRKLGSSGALFYGYPLAVRWMGKSAKGWSGGFAVPAFLQAVDYELDGSILTLRPADDPPRANPQFLKSIASSAEERRALLDELGLTGDQDGALENGLADLAVRLVQTQPQIDVIEEIDPTSLARKPDVTTLDRGGLYNRANLMLGERSKYTHGLEAELERLRDKVPDAQLAQSAVSLVFADAAAALISEVAESDLQFEGSTVYLSVGKGAGDARLRE